MNKVFILGRLTSDVKLQQTNTGKSFAKFTVAVNRVGGSKVTDFISCTAWENRAIALNDYTKKGDKILIEGTIETQSWEKDGVKQYSTNVNVLRTTFLTNAPADKQEEAEEEIEFSDITF